MKIRTGFVSNSSSASFVVEVKGESDKILNALYENIEDFQEANYIKLLEKNIKWNEDRLAGNGIPVSDSERKHVEYLIAQRKEEIDWLKRTPKVDWSNINAMTKEQKEFTLWKEKDRIKRIVLGVLELKHYYPQEVNDDWISFNSGCCTIYNGWENITMHKTLIEMLAFFMFMKYDVRTRIEQELQA